VAKQHGLGSRISEELVAVDEQLKHRYLPSLDGWTAAWVRVPWILSSNSILLKQ